MVDWLKVEQKPQKGVKIAGQVLLDFRKKTQDLTSQLNNLKDQLEKSEAMKKNLDTNLKDANAKIKDLEEKLESQKDEYETKVAKMEGETKALKEVNESTVGKLESRVKDLEGKVSGLETDKDDLTQKLITANSALEDNKSVMEKLNAENDSLNKQLVEIESRCKMLEDALAERDYDFFKKTLQERAKRATGDDLGLDQ